MNLPSSKEFSSLDWEEIHPLYQRIMDIDLTQETLDTWMKAWSDLRKLVDERYARLSLATVVNTADEKAEARFHAFLEDIYPRVQAADQELKKKLLESNLVPNGMKLALKNMQIEADLFREENLPLITEESKLGTDYSKIFGAQTVQWQGQELTITQARGALMVDDRKSREELWGLMGQRQLEDRNAINDLWKKFMEIRKEMAFNADFPDYRSFRWKQRLRTDYSPEESKQFIKAVKDVVVPAASRTYQRYQVRLGIEQVRPWDLHENRSTFNLPAIQAFDTEEEFITNTGKIFHQLDPVLGDYFQQMDENGLLDLMNRKNKGPGGFCTSFATESVPFIFMNATGKGNDLRVLFHECGHAFHVFERTNLPYHHQWQPGMEFAEVASFSMELLAESYLSKDQGGFLLPKDAAMVRLLNLEGKLLFWPYMAVVVAFQHWVYENHQQASNPIECDRKWSELLDIYMPGIDWTGYEEVKMTGWHRKLHIHLSPFYYIEYGLATLGAFQIWERAQEDQKRVLEDYRQALALGGTKTITDLFQTAGAKLSFDAETLGHTVELIEKNLEELENQLV